MAVLKSVLGTFNQSMGNITFSKWKDQNVAKQKVPANNTSNSGLQQIQRNKFGVLAVLGGAIGPALRVGFRTSASTMTEQNVFQSKNKANVVVDDDNVVTVLVKQLIISAGNVEPLQLSEAAGNSSTHQIVAAWTDNSNGTSALPDDLVTIVCINQVTLESVQVVNGARRDAKRLAVPTALLTAANAYEWSVFGFAKRASSTATSASTVTNISL